MAAITERLTNLEVGKKSVELRRSTLVSQSSLMSLTGRMKIMM